MFVCLCAGITDKQINNYLDRVPNASFEKIKAELGVALNCGKCSEYVLDMMPKTEYFPLERNLQCYDLMKAEFA